MTNNLSVKETSRRLEVTPQTIVRWIHRGHFPGAHKLDPTTSNSPYRIPEDDVNAFHQSRLPEHT